jgi:DNA polymerase I-like protein with 3'-5' exonuclease and polymerase domains
MIILDCPSYMDIQRGEYVAGPTGYQFEQLLSRAGLSRANVLITAVCQHALPNQSINWYFDDKGHARNPMDLMVHTMRLAGEIEKYNPNVIVAMGEYALQLLTMKGHWNKRRHPKTKEIIGWTGLSDWRGSIIDGFGIACDRKVIAMQPIETVIANWRNHPYWVADAVRVNEQSAFPEIRRHHRQLLIDPPDVEDRIDQLLASPDPIAFDIEFYNGNFLCCGFCAYEDWSLTISNRHPAFRSLVERVLQSGHDLSAQNAMFDCGVLEWHEGIETFSRLTFDTILAAHATNIELPKDLGTLASIYTEEPCYWDKTDWSGLGTRWSFDDMLTYNCLDAWVTFRIRQEQLRLDLTNPAVRATFDFELALLRPLWDISRRGIAWSMAQVEKVREHATSELEDVQSLLDALYPDLAPINVASSKQVGHLLYDVLGVDESFGQQKEKRRLTNDLVLAAIGTNPRYKGTTVAATVSLLRKARKHRSMISKFCGDGTDDSGITVDDDGRFRSTYVPSATDTGRLSAKIFFPTGRGANAQNQPRDKEVRRCFIPDPSYTIGYNDLERAESFVVAKITGDRTMLEHHLPGRNAHRLLGATLFGKAGEELNADEYYLSKKTRHAGNYMQGWLTFMNNVNKEAEKTGVILDARTAKKLIGTYREMHPGLAKWWNAVEYQVKQTRTLHNLFGRPRVFYGRVDAELPAAVAFIPQSTVGDCMNYAILNLWNSGLARPDSGSQRIEMLAQIHDALVYQFPTVPDDEMMALLREVRQHMLIPITNSLDGEQFIINTMPSISHVSWGDCKELTAAELGII